MKYSLGDIVIFLQDSNKQNRYIIIATENQKLDKNYLDSLNGKFNIKYFSKLAENVVTVTPGFKYKISKCADNYSKGMCVLESKFIDIMDDDKLSR